MLKLFLFLLALFSFCTGAVLAQGKLKNAPTRSPFTYIYSVSDKEAYKIYKDGNQAVDASHFQLPIDSFIVKEGFHKQLPQGIIFLCTAPGPSWCTTSGPILLCL